VWVWVLWVWVWVARRGLVDNGNGASETEPRGRSGNFGRRDLLSCCFSFGVMMADGEDV